MNFLARHQALRSLLRTRQPWKIPLLIGHHVVLQHPDPANLYFDGVTGDDVPVGILGAHPDYVAGVEGGVAA